MSQECFPDADVDCMCYGYSVCSLCIRNRGESALPSEDFVDVAFNKFITNVLVNVRTGHMCVLAALSLGLF